MTGATFHLVFVCTANQARSPLAAAVARRLLPADVTVASVGVRAAEGLPPLPEAAAAARRLGLDLGGHRSAPLLRGSLAGADLVLGFEQIHVAGAVVDGGSLRERTFTLPQLVDLLSRSTGASATERISEAAARRAQADVSTAPAILDPVGRPQRVVDGVVAEIDTLTRRLVAQLFGRQR